MWGYKAFIVFDCTVRKGYKPFPTCLAALGRVGTFFYFFVQKQTNKVFVKLKVGE
ncbi:hypothetical protein [uncultured Gammaproteobacteria bacterium]|nr:hypothetical protein [uncultured Gammaproteobacteria bacterium]